MCSRTFISTFGFFDLEQKLLPEGAASYEISADGTEFTFNCLKIPHSNGIPTSDEIKKSLKDTKK